MSSSFCIWLRVRVCLPANSRWFSICYYISVNYHSFSRFDWDDSCCLLCLSSPPKRRFRGEALPFCLSSPPKPQFCGGTQQAEQPLGWAAQLAENRWLAYLPEVVPCNMNLIADLRHDILSFILSQRLAKESYQFSARMSKNRQMPLISC